MKIIYLALLMMLSSSIFAAPPTTPTSNLGFYAADGAYFNIGWTPGNGAHRLLICKAGSPVDFKPQDGVAYTANTIFGSGQQVAPGEFAVYNGASSSYFLTGLMPATHYYFAMFEYNGTGADIEYLTDSYLTGDASTSATPAVQVSNAVFSNITATTVALNWTNGDGLHRIIVVKEGIAVDADPVNNTSYIDNANFGNGSQIGTGNYVVYRSTDNGTTIRNLKPGTEYHLAIYEFNGSAQPQYKFPGYTATVTTRSGPTVASSNAVVTKADGKELSLSWTSGNGQRRIVVAKKGSAVTAVPVNNTIYTANNVFGSGSQLAPGEYVVFDDNFNQANIKGLDTASTYFFKIFEYDGGNGVAAYLASAYGSAQGITAATPSLQANISAASIEANSVLLNVTGGNGRARMIVAKKGRPVDFAPQDFTAYTSNSDFGSGTELGNGNFVVANTTDASASVYKLEANTTYYFAVFDYNGYNEPLYLQPLAATSAKTLSPLPIKLAAWNALAQAGKVSLRWTTAQEINSSHFIIQRGVDGIHFTDLTLVPAAGNSQVSISYSRQDEKPINGRSYYRLKMVDKDSRFEYSGVLTVALSSDQRALLLQNPVRQNVELSIPALTIDHNSQWQVINISGQPVREGKVTNTRMSINVGALPAGNYWLRLEVDKQLQTLPFTKL